MHWCRCAAILISLCLLSGLMTSCSENSTTDPTLGDEDYSSLYPNFYAMFRDKIDLTNLPDYKGQSKPAYITKDNSAANPIDNRTVILGRVLFYDKNLSSNQTVSCSTCHRQANAFSDTNLVSAGVNGQTSRHAMRLINSRFGVETKFFWDERAGSLENQTTLPIQDHNEMGFSGLNGDPALPQLIERMEQIGYYRDLFNFAFGSSEINETKIQKALAQFIRSIQSFDSKYDSGRFQVGSDGPNFPNFTTDENAGKRLFIAPPQQGGLGCAGCHRPPEFDIDPLSGNNGLISVFGNVASSDTTVTRSPSLRDLVKPDGSSNGSFMHDGSLATIEAVVEHYNSGITDNPGLDPRLKPNGLPLRLNLSIDQKRQLSSFLKTLSGTDVYSNTRWSDPF